MDMPIYEYRCSKCGKTFEALQGIGAPPITKCIYCQGKTKKIVSLSSFQFKGKGWYITDYKKTDTANGKTIKESQPKKEVNKTDHAKIN
ncbi:MAG: zinc ribbon domain-containing protein [Candidatus Aminicenantes bacterium]|nr:zinc ribbon domain-containing protein [Candidatus Aminicenantes bacterium]